MHAPRTRVTLLTRYGVVALVGLLVSAYWWLPLCLNLEHMGTGLGIQQQSRAEIFAALMLAQESGGLVMAVLAGGGLAYLVAVRRYRTAAFFVSVGVISLLLALNTINRFLPFGSVVGSSQCIRFQAFFAWLMMVWAGFGLAGIAHLAHRVSRPPWAMAGVAGVTVILFVMVIVPSFSAKRGFIRVVETEATAELPAAARYLDAHLRPGEFVLTESNWGSRVDFGSPHFVNQRLPFFTNNTWDLNGNFEQGTDGANKPFLIAHVLGQTGYVRTQRPYLASRGMRYLVSTHPTTKQRLLKESWLQLVWQARTLAIFEVRGFASPLGLPPTLGQQVKAVNYDDVGRYDITFTQPVTIPADTTLAVSYHPWLTVTAGDQGVRTSRDGERRLTLRDPVGPTSTLTITYRPGPGAVLSRMVSILTGLAVVMFLLKPGGREVPGARQPTLWCSPSAARTVGTRSASSAWRDQEAEKVTNSRRSPSQPDVRPKIRI